MNRLRASLYLVLALDRLMSAHAHAHAHRLVQEFRGSGPSQNERFKRFSIRNKNTLKWNKRKITYHFLNFSCKMEPSATRAEFARAADEWSRHSGLSLHEADTDKADLLLSFGTGRHGDTRFDPPFDGRSGSLAHAFPPDGSPIAGDIHFDDDENWAVNATADDHAKTDFYSVALHELGHSLGLSHSDEERSVMSAEYGERLKTNLARLQPDDIAGVQTLYAHFITSRPTDQPNSGQSWKETNSRTKFTGVTIGSTIVPKHKHKPIISSETTITAATNTTNTTETTIITNQTVTLTQHETTESVGISSVKTENRKSGGARSKIKDDREFAREQETIQNHPDVDKGMYPNAGVTFAPAKTPSVSSLDNTSAPTMDPPQTSSAATLLPMAALWTTLYVLYLEY